MRYNEPGTPTRSLIEAFEEDFQKIKKNKFHQMPLVLDVSGLGSIDLLKLRQILAGNSQTWDDVAKIDALAKERGTW